MAYSNIDTCNPIGRPAKENPHQLPQSAAEFGRPVSYKGSRPPAGVHGHPRVVDCRSCRQIYLRSYTFSRKESMQEKTKKCFGKIRERIKNRRSRKRPSSNSKGCNYSNSNKRSLGNGKSLREVSCAALLSVFKRLLSCTTEVDVAEHGNL